MSVAAAGIHKAINTIWDSTSLDGPFTNLWVDGITDSDYQVLNDGAAGPAQPMPYCVFEQSAGSTVARMTGSTRNIKREIQNVPFEFRVHARTKDGDSRTAKEIAAFLVEEIMKVFGGHPTVTPSVLTLDQGNSLLVQYQSDYGVRTGDDEYQWIVSYNILVDSPVAVPA